jgi:hypothetical protein
LLGSIKIDVTPLNINGLLGLNGGSLGTSSNSLLAFESALHMVVVIKVQKY